MKITIVIVLLFALSHQECVKGCLKCSSAGVCQVCNVAGGYYAVNSTCAMTELTNCAVLSQAGSCVACASSYYLDSATSKCVAVPTNNTVANCGAYSGSIACTACVDGYYISAAACVQANITIANCKTYSANGVCTSCNSGFITSLNGTNCTAITASANCLAYTYAGCSKCKSGYFMNRNLFYQSYKSSSDASGWVYAAMGSLVGVPLAVCEAVTLTNCAVFANASTCQTCNSGYYLSAGSCFANPDPVVPNCSIYNSLISCYECKTGFFADNGACTAVVPIAYCQTYSTRVSPTTCTACNATSFVSSNVCVNRTLSSISNCLSYRASADECATCNSGFYLTTDGKKCLAVIANCAGYATSSVSTTALTCQACLWTYVLTTTNGVTTCVAGTIANCNQYNSASDCAVCANTYYRASATTCTKHVTIANCNTYHASTANTCSTCSRGYILFGYFQTCIANTNLVTNCGSYNPSSGACIACNNGYYLSQDGLTCTAIPSGSNCLKMNFSLSCQTCATGYNLWSYPSPVVCVTPLDYISANCETFTTTANYAYSNTNNYCMACKSNNVPFRPVASEGICIKTTDMPYLAQTASWTVERCVRYGLQFRATLIAASLVCMECESGYFLTGYETNKELSTALTCAACSTTGGAKIIIPDDFLGFVNICITPANFGIAGTNYVTRFARAVYNANTNADYKIIGGDPTGMIEVTFDADSMPEIPPASATAAIVTSTKFFHPFALGSSSVLPTIFNFKGLPISAVVVKPTPTNDWTPNCELSGAITGAGSIGKGDGTANIVAGGTAFWAVISASTKVCFKCALGYYPTFAAMNPTAPATGNIPYPKCASMTNCQDSTSIIGGLPMYLNSLVSCYSCNANLFPWIYWEFLAVAASGVFPNTLLNFQMKGDLTGVGFNCAASSNVITSGTATPVALANCGVFGGMTPLTDSGSARTIGSAINVCLACATAFVPTYQGTSTSGGLGSATYLPYYAITACTASANCDTTQANTNKAFNTCGRCSIASVSATPPIFYAFTDHTMSHCQPSISNNCFVLASAGISTATPATNVCLICMSGYFLNQDKVCELLTVPNMASGASFSTSYFGRKYLTVTQSSGWSVYHARIHYLLSFQKSQYGVSACAASYTRAAPSFYASSLCVTSAYLPTISTVPNGSNYIPNCSKYDTKGDNQIPAAAPFYTCNTCATNFIPKADGSACVATISNCLLANSATITKCYKCASGYWNVKGACGQTAFANCTTLANNQIDNDIELTCSLCKTGFFKDTDGTCKPGLIQNCDAYGSSDAENCSVCLAGFALISAKAKKYCYPIPSSLNCMVLPAQDGSISNAAGLQEGQITCASCVNSGTSLFKVALWSAQTTTTLAQNTCLPFSTITNCLEYVDYLNNFNSNSLLCSSCGSGYYLDTSGRTCIARTVKPDQCASYHNSQDKCLICNSGYFINVTQDGCVAFPIGIPNCVVYSSSSACVKCGAGYYLSSNACVASTVVANCAVYSANYTCSACNSGYFLTNSTLCSQATAQNCLTYTSVSVCATCAFGWAITTANSITSCTAITIANCAILNPTNQNSCAYCNSGFYLNSAGVCTAVTTTVSNCAYYSGAAKCSNCTQGFILAVDGSACMNNYTSIADANCGDAFLQPTPACAVCGLGYYFGSSGCMACGLLDSGCAVCDSTNSTNCLLCNPAYYMSASGSCNKIDTGSTTNNTNTTPVTPSGVGRLTVWTFILMIVGFVVRLD